MNDNFSSIVKAVMWGRSVFCSIRKFLQVSIFPSFFPGVEEKSEEKENRFLFSSLLFFL